jgi:hypothetical protein
MLMDTNLINDWLSGIRLPGVLFGVNDAAFIVAGPHQGEAVAVISIVELEPEICYSVELRNGSDLVVKQSYLNKIILEE